MKVCIDVGSTQVLNKTFGITSKQLSNELVALLSTELQKSGCEVINTQSKSPQHLSELLTQHKVSKCIGIGLNSYNGIVSGSETFITETAGSRKLGNQLHSIMVSVLGLRDKGVSTLDSSITIPYVHLSLGFIDNDVDVMIIQDNLKELATEITSSLV